MIQKHGYWVAYELKPRNSELRLFTYEMLLARHKREDRHGKNSCIFGKISLASCIMSTYPNGTKRLLGLSIENNDAIEPTLMKKCLCYSRHDKSILLQDKACQHVAAPVITYLETLN